MCMRNETHTWRYTMYEFCDKDTGKVYPATESEAKKWATKNYHETEMMLRSMTDHAGQWYNGMFRDCRRVSE